MPQKIWDAVVVGSGAGGSLAFQHYVSKGLKVLMLEEGTDTLSSVKSFSVSEITYKLYRNGGLRIALGLPSLTIGEGKAIGGGTEINGGLFWRTPDYVLQTWLHLAPFVDQDEYKGEFAKLEQELGVSVQQTRAGFDLDSEKLDLGSKALGWKICNVPRLVVGCERRNLCPSGCPSGAKQSMSRTIISNTLENGGYIKANIRIESLSKQGDLLVLLSNNSEQKEILTKKVVISAGAIETPRILRRSRLIRPMVSRIGFHSNLKVIAKFSEDIYSEKGTIFTKQIQEFLEDGIVIMASNFRIPYLAMASSHLNGAEYSDLLKDMPNLAMYTVQVKTDSVIRDFKIPFLGFIPIIIWKNSDKKKVRQALNYTSQVLFAAGANYIVLPFSKDKKCYNLAEAINKIKKLRFSTLNITTVHLMSSLGLSTNVQSALDDSAHLKTNPQIQVLDASILPTTVGESPQGSIMAMVRLMLKRSDTHF